MKGQFLRAAILRTLGTAFCASTLLVSTAFAAPHGESTANSGDINPLLQAVQSSLDASPALRGVTGDVPDLKYSPGVGQLAEQHDKDSKGVDATVAKVNDYKKDKDGQLTNGAHRVVKESFRPIEFLDALGHRTSYIDKAIVDGDRILIPIKVFRTVSTNNLFQDKAGNYIIRLPQIEAKGDTFRIKNYNKTLGLYLPLISKDGVDYVPLGPTTDILGITATEVKGRVLLKGSANVLSVPVKVEVKAPISWVFDPYGGIPYSKPLSPVGSSVVSPSWFELTEDGIRLSGDVRASYVDSYQKNGYLVWPLITNQFDDALTSRILHNPDSWGRYAQQLALYALIYGYSGYNFDFENVDYKDKQALTTFVTYLSKFLHQFNIYTSIDVTGYSDSENWSMVYDRKRLGEAVDYVALMAYDQYWATSPQAGPVASLPWVKANLEAIAKEVPRDKLVLGVPFYMRLWRTPVVNGKDQRAHSVTLTMTGSAAYKKAFADRMQWLDKEQLHYVTWREPAGPGYTTEQLTAPKTDVEWAALSKAKTYNRYEIWFEDPMSLAAKLDLVKSEGIAGYAAWRKGFEDDNTHKLLGEAFVPSEPDRMEAAIH